MGNGSGWVQTGLAFETAVGTHTTTGLNNQATTLAGTSPSAYRSQTAGGLYAVPITVSGDGIDKTIDLYLLVNGSQQFLPIVQR